MTAWEPKIIAAPRWGHRHGSARSLRDPAASAIHSVGHDHLKNALFRFGQIPLLKPASKMPP